MQCGGKVRNKEDFAKQGLLCGLRQSGERRKEKNTLVANIVKRNYTIGRRIKIIYLLNTLKKLSQQGFIHEKEN